MGNYDGFLLVWLAYIFCDVGYNLYVIEIKKQRPFYLVLNIVRAMAAILHGALVDAPDFGWYKHLLIFQMTSFWIIFDLTLNIARNKPILYVGENSGWIDRMFFGHHGFLLAAKILALILLLLSLHSRFILRLW